MKKQALFVFVALVAGAVLAETWEKPAPIPREKGLYRCQIHRGGGKKARPDNSLETFLWCWGHGCTPEADARLTKDGVAIAMHDDNLKRIGRGISPELAKKKIKDLTWDEVRDVDTGSYLGPEYATTRLATMENGVPKIEKIPQLGIVELGDGVEIGSNTTIDRARIGRTYIGPMTKIDNLVQIGHNVKVAGYSGIIAQAGVAGSTQIGTGCLIWAQAGISGHIKIADGVQVGPQAGVPQTLDGSEKYVVGTPATSLKNVAAISLAPKMIMKLRQDVKALKEEVAKLAAKDQP